MVVQYYGHPMRITSPTYPSLRRWFRKYSLNVSFCAVLCGLSCALYSCASVQDVTPSETSFFTLPDSSNNTFPLTGTWSFQREGIDSFPHNIKVPANWFTESIGEQRVDFAGACEYTRTFMLPEKLTTSQLFLVFEGVDYETDVWLNDVYLGKHTGYFAPFAFSIQKEIHTNKPNKLRVRVNSPSETDEDWSLKKRLIKGIFGHHDTRPGGAWSKRGQEQNTGGIWGKVYLQAGSFAHITGLKCTTILVQDTNSSSHNSFNNSFNNSLLNSSNQHVHLRIQASMYAARGGVGNVQFSLRPENFSDSTADIATAMNISIHQGLNVLDTIISVKNAKLWYPADVGFPHLYVLKTSISLDSPTNATTDTITRYDKLGFRTVLCDTATQQWFINGKRLFLRGTNYIGTQWLSTMGKAEYLSDIQLMKEANINAVRVHAHIARKDFYDACDEAGILVWQDFPLQWGYSDDPDFFRAAHAQTKEMIHSLFNHPSIFAWCMHNEPPFDADWMIYKYKNYSPLQNKHLNDVLTKAARKLDSTRYVYPFSATKEHHWQGWYGGKLTDHAAPTKTRIISEFGAQALPELATLKNIVGEKALFPTTEQEWVLWEYHNFQKMETFQNAHVPMGATPEEFIANTQAYQTALTRLAAESYRKQKYSPVSSIFQFMFVENWASINWGIVDFQRKKKPAYFALKQAYTPTTAFHEYDSTTQSVKIWIVNDAWKSFPKSTISCTLQAVGAMEPPITTKPNGLLLPFQKTWQCSIPADTSYVVVSWKVPPTLASRLMKNELRLQTTLSLE